MPKLRTTFARLSSVNTRFVIRGLLIALPVAVLATAAALALVMARARIGPPPGPTPPPPTILAPRGELPAGQVGLEEWVQVQGEPYRLAGSGFLLLLESGALVRVTTAHSVSLGDPNHLVERIALRVAGRSDFVAEFDTLHGQPGRARTGKEITVDYVLLHADRPVDPGLVLAPDPRGAPQPGERVSLVSGLGDGDGGRRVLEGTVQSVGDTAVWALMDELFHPGIMSGSPFLSQHTGQVVGMAVAASPRRDRLLLGVHPIGSIVRLAESATDFPRVSEFRR
jgi:hypothetical protein